MTKDQLRANLLRNMGPEWVAWYESLPTYSDDMVVKCPTKTNGPGGEPVPIPENDLPGCGGTLVLFDGEVYDCIACGIFFSPFAADPPHRREREPHG